MKNAVPPGEALNQGLANSLLSTGLNVGIYVYAKMVIEGKMTPQLAQAGMTYAANQVEILSGMPVEDFETQLEPIITELITNLERS